MHSCARTLLSITLIFFVALSLANISSAQRWGEKRAFLRVSMNARRVRNRRSSVVYAAG